MIRAQVVRALTQDLSGMREERVERQPMSAGMVRVRLRAASVNFPDFLMIQGGYQHKPDLPFIPGMEAAGEIVEVGAGVVHLRPGQRVVVGARHGCFAEEILVSAAQIRSFPKSYSFVQGASFSSAYLTAYVALVRKGILAAGETLLVHGAAGGVGLAAVDLGKHLGANVIATASTEEKRAFLSAYGADHVLASQGFREKVKEVTNGRGADVVFDPVGGDVFDESTRCIAFDGRLLVIGFAGGRIAQVSTNIALIKGFSIIGVRAGEYGRQFPERGAENLKAIAALAEQEKLRPFVCGTFPLEQAHEALTAVASRRVIGRVVLTMNDLEL